MTLVDPGALPPRLLDGGAGEADALATAELLARSDQALSPPGDLALERVWREVARDRRGGPRRPQRRWRLALGGAAVLTTAGLAALLLRMSARSPAPGAQLDLTAGSVLTAGAGGSWTEARAGGALPVGSQLRTQGRSRAVLSLERSTVLLSPDSDLEIGTIGAQTVLRLSHGEVLADVEPRREGEAFVVQTTRYRVTVKGTIFAVSERSPGDVAVSVSRGRVEVTGSDGSWSVPAGSAWHSSSPGSPFGEEIEPRDRSLLAEVAAAGGPRATVRVEAPDGFEVSEGGVDLGPAPIVWDAPLGRYHFTGAAGAAHVEGDATTSPGVASRLMLAPPGGAARSAPTPQAASPDGRPMESAMAPAPPRHPVARLPLDSGRESARTPREPFESSAASPATAAKAGSPLLAGLDAQVPHAGPAGVAPAAAPAPAVVGAADPYLDALALCSAGRYREGAAALSALAGSSGPHAELALYHLARLEQHQLGEPAEGLRDFLRYQQRYPAGTLAQETELSIIELELRRASLADARSQMDRFLAEHPDGERAPDVHLLRGNLLRKQGDCRAALRDYDRARGNEGIESEALFLSGRCEEQLGQPDAATIRFQDYLDRFPAGQRASEARAALDGR